MRGEPEGGSLAAIAARCCVSRRVVAAVLSPQGRGTVGFSEATRRRVEAAAREAGYQANRTARWLARGRHGSIGVVARSSYLIPDAMMNGMLLESRRRGLFLAFDRPLADESTMFLDASGVDGLISFDDLSVSDVRRIARMKLPTLWVNTNRRRGRNVVTYDERGAARMAIEHLRERGWAQPATLDFAGIQHYSSSERRRGALDAVPGTAPFLSRAGVSGTDEVAGRRADELEQFLRAHPRVDGALACSSALVPPLYEALRRVGRRPGGDFGVVTFGRYGPARSVFPLATALALDEHTLGERIVAALDDLAEGRTGAGLPLKVAYELVVRGSTAGDEEQ